MTTYNKFHILKLVKFFNFDFFVTSIIQVGKKTNFGFSLLDKLSHSLSTKDFAQWDNYQLQEMKAMAILYANCSKIHSK